MADSIDDTLILEGEVAENFLNNLDKPLTERKKQIFKEMRSQRRVPLWECPKSE